MDRIQWEKELMKDKPSFSNTYLANLDECDQCNEMVLFTELTEIETPGGWKSFCKKCLRKGLTSL